MHYIHDTIRAHVESFGMVYDEAEAETFDRVAYASGLTQEQFQVCMTEHAWRVKHLFTPTNYNYWTRVKLALYFLNPFMQGE